MEILNQKKTELQKQLEDLDSEQCKLDDSIQDVLKKCEEEKLTLKQLKSKLASQKSDVREQEQELHKGRKELEELRKEESLLEQQVAESSKKLEKLKNKVAADKNEALQVCIVLSGFFNKFFSLLILNELFFHFVTLLNLIIYASD